MRKSEFILALKYGLSGLPEQDVEEQVAFYCEMIEDRMEEGLSEEEAIAGIGSVDEIISQIAANGSFAEQRKTGTARKKMRAWEIVLLVLGAPVWLPLLISVFVILLAGYICVWSVIVSVWAVFVSVAVCAVGGVVIAAMYTLTGNVLAGFAIFGMGVVCAGLSILLFLGCKAVTEGTLLLTKKIVHSWKNRLTDKERGK